MGLGLCRFCVCCFRFVLGAWGGDEQVGVGFELCVWLFIHPHKLVWPMRPGGFYVNFI